MLKFGIDKISFATSHYSLDLAELAKARGLKENKFYTSLGQHKMSIAAPDEDIVTIAANAAEKLLKDEDKESISTVLFATESSVDQSKAAAIYVHELLELSPYCRALELKQACYSATAGLQMALALLQTNPKQKILLIASDIARYGLNATGESSQGGGAVAMLLTANPRLIAIESHSSFYTTSAMDFWRPNYRDEALVDGKASSKLYLSLLEKTWLKYCENSQRQFSDHDYFCYHTPVPNLAERAHKHLLKVSGLSNDFSLELVNQQVGPSLRYSRQAGNCYAASLYLGICSLLENNPEDLTNRRLGLYSYGSGCTAEYFSGIVQPNYQTLLTAQSHQEKLNKRISLSYEEYKKVYSFQLPQDGSNYETELHTTGSFRLAGINKHQRQYTHNSL